MERAIQHDIPLFILRFLKGLNGLLHPEKA